MDIDEIEDDNEWIAEEEVHRGGQSQLEIMNVLLGTKGALSSEGVRHRRIRRAPSSSLHFNEPPVAARHSSPDPAQIRSPELIHRKGPWRNIEHFEWATLTYIDWFNRRRIHESLGHVTPTEFEDAYYALNESENLAVLETI